MTIWDPYYLRDIDSLEQVQRHAARFTTGDYHTTSSVTAMLAELGWKWLEDRRKDLRLALLYKIVHGHVAVPVDALNLEPPDPRTRKKHKYTYKHLTPHTDPCKHFFCAALFPSGTLSLPALWRLHLLSLSRLIWQAIPRGTSFDQAPQPIRDTLQRRTADYATRPDQTRWDTLVATNSSIENPYDFTLLDVTLSKKGACSAQVWSTLPAYEGLLVVAYHVRATPHRSAARALDRV